MIRALAIILLFGGMVRADDAADRAALDRSLPAGFTARSVEFITPDVAVAEGGGTLSKPAWDIVLKRTASGWQVARPVPRESRDTSDQNAIRILFTEPAKPVESREIWCELECLQFSTVGSISFITPDVALVEGEIRTGMMPAGAWLAIVRRVGDGWRVAFRRSIK